MIIAKTKTTWVWPISVFQFKFYKKYWLKTWSWKFARKTFCNELFRSYDLFSLDDSSSPLFVAAVKTPGERLFRTAAQRERELSFIRGTAQRKNEREAFCWTRVTQTSAARGGKQKSEVGFFPNPRNFVFFPVFRTSGRAGPVRECGLIVVFVWEWNLAASVRSVWERLFVCRSSVQKMSSSSSHHPFGHLNHNNNNTNSNSGSGGGLLSGLASVNHSGAPPHHNNLQPQLGAAAAAAVSSFSAYEDFDDVDNEQTQQQQELLFDDDDNMDDSDQGKRRGRSGVTGLWCNPVWWLWFLFFRFLDTEEASETELGSSGNHRNIDEPVEIKEQWVASLFK